MRRLHLLALALALLLPLPLPATAQVLTSTLLPGTIPQAPPDWHDATAWDTDPLAPFNGNGGFDFEAEVSGYVRLQQDVTLDGLTVGLGGQVEPESDATLTILGPLVTQSARFGSFGPATGTIVAEGGLSLTDRLTIDGVTVIHRGLGIALESPGSFHAGILFTDAGRFVNEGGFLIANEPRDFEIDAITGQVGVFENLGTLIADKPSGFVRVLGDVTFINSGLVEARTGWSIVDYVDAGGTLRATSTGGFGGGPYLVPIGRVEGDGGGQNFVIGGVLSPGVDGVGTLEFSDLVLQPGAQLLIDVGGTVKGVDSDYVVNDSSAITVGGDLVVSFVNGFVNQVEYSDFVVVMQAETGQGIDGAFDNVPPGGRLTTAGGRVEFTVAYGPGAANPDQVVLKDFVVKPKPKSCGLAGPPWILLPLLLARRRRSRH